MFYWQQYECRWTDRKSLFKMSYEKKPIIVWRLFYILNLRETNKLMLLKLKTENEFKMKTNKPKEKNKYYEKP